MSKYIEVTCLWDTEYPTKVLVNTDKIKTIQKSETISGETVRILFDNDEIGYIVKETYDEIRKQILGK